MWFDIESNWFHLRCITTNLAYAIYVSNACPHGMRKQETRGNSINCIKTTKVFCSNPEAANFYSTQTKKDNDSSIIIEYNKIELNISSSRAHGSRCLNIGVSGTCTVDLKHHLYHCTKQPLLENKSLWWQIYHYPRGIKLLELHACSWVSELHIWGAQADQGKYYEENKYTIFTMHNFCYLYPKPETSQKFVLVPNKIYKE